MSKTIADLILTGETELQKVGLDNPRMEAEVLLGGLLNQPRTHLSLNFKEQVQPQQAEQYHQIINRRSKFEPVAYIQKKKNFMGIELTVTPDVLVPRPETENVVEQIEEWLRHHRISRPRILDMCTGSGCMGLYFAHKFPDSSITAVDISDKALNVAKLNARRLGFLSQCTFIQSNLYRELGPTYRGYFDIIMSNPPYISETEFCDLSPDLFYEPRQALDGGKDGFKYIQPLIQGAPHYLKKRGALFLEIGWKQKEKAIHLIMRSGGFNIISAQDDLGQDRMVGGQFVGSV